MLAILSGFLRRILGGWLSNIPVIKERGVQWLICALLYAPVLYFRQEYYHTYLSDNLPNWLFVILGTFLIILAETKGHFPGFQCGTEDPKYIDECLKNGRKIPYRNLVTWFGKIRGYQEFDKEWCFWQLILCKTVWCIPVCLFVGSQFFFIGLATAFVYNACFWVQLKPFKNILTSPTNWGEFFQGVLYFQGLF